MQTTFSVQQPFSLSATLDSHGWLWTHPFHPDPAAGRLVRIERIRGTPRHIEIHETRRSAEGVRLVATSDAPDRDRAAVRRVVRTVLGLDEDLGAFYAMAARDPHLAPLVDRGAGRTCRGTSLWEDATKGIIQTNIQWRQALRCMATIATLGKRHGASGLHAWPTPDEILSAGASWLKGEARIGYRAEAVIQLAAEVRSGARDLDALAHLAPSLDTTTLVHELQTMRGIGPATAHTLAGFLGKHDVVSVDSSTIAYVAQHYPDHFDGERPTPSEVRAVFRRYGPWQGKAWWYEAWLKRHMAIGPIDPRS